MAAATGHSACAGATNFMGWLEEWLNPDLRHLRQPGAILSNHPRARRGRPQQGGGGWTTTHVRTFCGSNRFCLHRPGITRCERRRQQDRRSRFRLESGVVANRSQYNVYAQPAYATLNIYKAEDRNEDNGKRHGANSSWG